MFISYNDIGSLFEGTNIKILASRDDPSISNKFSMKAKGVLISDSFNNPFLPIHPRPRIDTANLDLVEIFRRCRELYFSETPLILPWHFCIEMVDDRYFVFNTRPLDMKFPLTNSDVSNTSENWKADTQEFMKSGLFDISEAVHVCIIGDTTFDVYPKKMYELLGRTCTVPTIRREKLPGINQSVFGLNLGHRFKLNYLSKFVRK